MDKDFATPQYARDGLLRELRNPTEWVTDEVGLSEKDSEKLVAARDKELLLSAADTIEREEAAEYPGPILGAIRRMRARYYADKLRRMAANPSAAAGPTPKEKHRAI